ncbi:MAG: alpha/beta hydrolase [Sediminibacterium sp.]|nr:alpha/beta hydrolase [Sediminibacterium sp.]
MKSILLLHGAIGAQDQLIPLKEALHALHFDVYVLSFSGHFNRPFKANFSIAQFALELSDFITENKLEQPTVFGYSMGGYVALYLASQQPNLLGKIITLGTKFNWSPEIAAKEIKMLDPITIQEKVPKFAQALNERHGEAWIELLNKTGELMVGLGNNNLLTTERLQRIRNNVLLGLADGDTMVTEQETQFVYENLKQAQRFTVLNAKHPIETVDPEELAKTIQQFVSEEY